MQPHWTDSQWDDAFAAATRRAELMLAKHDTSPSSRPMSDGYELVGAYGEIVWARMHGLPDPRLEQTGGDGGRDFIHRVCTDQGGTKPISVDVKTARKAFYLIVPVGQVRADVYVLAAYIEGAQSSPRIKFIGWPAQSSTRQPASSTRTAKTATTSKR